MGIEKYKIVWFNVKQTKAPLNCVQYCGKDTLVLPVTPELCTVFSIEVAPYQRLPSWQQRFQSWLEAEWVIDTTESVMNLSVLIWYYPCDSFPWSCRKHVHPWKSKMNCMQGKEEIFVILECTCECEHTWFKQRYDKAYISTSHTYSLIECQDLTGIIIHSDKKMAWCISSFSVQTHLIWSDTMGTWVKCRDVRNIMGVTI